ncbi:periplasmic heavy metal sensor [Desulfococcaceae bacterium HSG8]|nr:periplasmic heavy metal sensor [Desulfococcaceae bacterium HSG8]
MKKLAFFTLICFLSLSCAGIAKSPDYSMSGPMGEPLSIPGGKWWRMPRVAKELTLTGEEQERLDSLFMENRLQMIDLKSALEKEKLELEAILDKKNFDESACMSHFNRLQEARQGLVTERFKFLVEVRKLLGNDRFQKLKVKFHERRMLMMKGKQGKKRLMKKTAE